MANLPCGYNSNYDNTFTTKDVDHLIENLKLKSETMKNAILSDLSFSVNCYKIESAADSTRMNGILNALRDLDATGDSGIWGGPVGQIHTLAAIEWVKRHGGKKQDSHKARIKYKKLVKSRPQGCAKYSLASSLARILIEYTDEVPKTSRNNGVALTQNGALAQIFQGVLTLVDGKPLKDPFPYLKFAISPR